MSWCDCEPTLDDILADPIVAAVMQADRVDPHAFETMLTEIARGLPPRVGDGAADARHGPDAMHNRASRSLCSAS